MICYLFSEPFYFLFSPDAPNLLYYSHVPTAIIAIFIGFFVILKGREFLLNRLLFFISVCFFAWVLSNLILWTNIHSDFMLFIWSFLRILSSLMSILCVYFIYVFLEKKDVSILLKSIFLALIIPVIALAPTYINLSGFSLTNCDAFMFEGILFQIFRVAFGILAMVWILILLIKKYHTAGAEFKRQILFMGIGIELFLFAFFTVTFLAAYLTKIGILSDSRLEYYGLFGMLIFMIYISILIVRFKTFHFKLLGVQALVWSLIALIGSQFFYMDQMPMSSLVITGITLIVSAFVGLIIVRSVKKDIEQKEALIKLNIDLKNVIQQRESLVHLVTHKVKGAFTRSKYIFAGILDGTFGEANDEVKRRASQGLESDNTGIQTVDLVLNASNLQKGAVKYDMKVMDFKEIILKIFEDKKVQAEAKGLQMESLIHNGKDDVYNVMGDVFWLREAINNLIDNSIKYTKTGKITIGLEDGNGKVKFSVKDTGVGITDEDKKGLFTEGGRGKDSVHINVDSTGYGLYTVKLVIDAHHSKVWGESEVGKGSTFYIEMDAVNEKQTKT